jgi:hypothetical protein
VKLLEDWRVFLILMAMAFTIVLTGMGRPADGQTSASAIVQISDPVDSWLGVGGDASGDLVLARTVAGNVRVSISEVGLEFTADGTDATEAQHLLATALAAYEAARTELRIGLMERLEVVPGLEEFVVQRRALVNRSSSDPPLDAEELSSIEQKLASLPQSTLAPLWQTTPVAERLSRIDRVLASAFWDAATSSR